MEKYSRTIIFLETCRYCCRKLKTILYRDSFTILVGAPPDVFNFAASTRRVEGVESLPSIAGKTANLSWYSLALIETLLRLAEVENYQIVRTIFKFPEKHCPELLLLGLAQAKVDITFIFDEVSIETCVDYLEYSFQRIMLLFASKYSSVKARHGILFGTKNLAI